MQMVFILSHLTQGLREALGAEGTSYPELGGTGPWEDESTQAKFFCNQPQNY